MKTNDSATQPATILVVDDMPDNLQILRHFLTAQGYTVRAAPGGERALAFARIAPPDLILLDVNMPEMDGFQVCEYLKADERTRDVPVLFLSALADIDNKVRGFEAGGRDYITKPFHAEEVLARVATHLALRRLQQHLETVVDERTAELRAAIERQTILLREIHHRTRNNMAVMSSLITLYARDVTDPAMLAMLRNLDECINSMAVVHQFLHQPDLTLVNLQDWIPQLAQKLLPYYPTVAARVTLTYDLAPVIMPVDTAVPLSMVLRELLSNALKHAFPEPRRGEIAITFQGADAGPKDLWVRDTGVGLPPGVDPAHGASIGMQLMTLIVQSQLHGAVTFEPAAVGTTVHVRFHEPQYPLRI